MEVAMDCCHFQFWTEDFLKKLICDPLRENRPFAINY